MAMKYYWCIYNLVESSEKLIDRRPKFNYYSVIYRLGSYSLKIWKMIW